MTWAEILQLSASSCLNDAARDKFTNDVLLPFLNLSRMELEEIFELNNIPVTNETSAVLAVPINYSAISFITSPALPAALVEIQEVWESEHGQDKFTPMVKKEYLTPALVGGTNNTRFGVWAWMNQELRLIPAIVVVDIKIDYIQSLFTMLTSADLNASNTVKNTSLYFNYRLAALASEFIDENMTRADKLNGFAVTSLEHSLGISVKGTQAIVTRRRPFRASYKRGRQII